MANQRDHGLHNRNICELLFKHAKGSANDWIVTTAFYAALHLVQSDIFPLYTENRVLSSFEQYYHLEHHNDKVNKHATTAQLVNKYLPEIGPKYTWLMKECMTARYRNYKVDDRVSNLARSYLKDVVDNTGIGS